MRILKRGYKVELVKKNISAMLPVWFEGVKENRQVCSAEARNTV